MACYIFDLDGTLANCDHRQDFALNKDWEEFHRLCNLDDPYPKIIQLLRDLQKPDNFITIITGRDEAWRFATMQWLKALGIDGWIDALYMRPIGNREPDHVYKLGVIDQMYETRELALESVTCWFEDRDNLVGKLRDAGFTVLQVKAGAY